jgi:hypothetical protein
MQSGARNDSPWGLQSLTFRWAAAVGGIPGESRSDLPPTRTRTALAAAAGVHRLPAICDCVVSGLLRLPACALCTSTSLAQSVRSTLRAPARSAHHRWQPVNKGQKEINVNR